MSTFLDLPKFDLPDYKNKKLSADVIYKWMQDNMSKSKKSGQMERIRQQETGRPVDSRFVLR